MIVNDGRPQVWSVGDPEIDPVDKERINAFSAHSFNAIGKPLPPRLYHYTNGDGLVGILTQQRLRASHIAYLNDVSEVRRSISALRTSLLSRPERTTDEGLNEFFSLCAELLDTALSDPAQLAQMWVACFSTRENQLSQWRAYGSYCLEFDSSRLKQAANEQSCALLPCDYNDITHFALIHEVTQKLIDMFVARRAEHAPDKQIIYGRNLFSFMMSQMSWLAPLLKHPAFEEESEWRIYRRRPDGDTRDIQFASRHGMITGHISFDLRHPVGLGKLLPITRVLVGPSRHVSLSCAAITAMLAQQGYSGIDVVDCKVPYRTD